MHWLDFEQWKKDIVILLCADSKNLVSLYDFCKFKLGSNYLTSDELLDIIKEQTWLIEGLIKEKSNLKPLFSDSAIMSGLTLNTINELNAKQINKIDSDIKSFAFLLDNACKIYAIFKEQKETGFVITKYL